MAAERRWSESVMKIGTVHLEYFPVQLTPGCMQ